MEANAPQTNSLKKRHDPECTDFAQKEKKSTFNSVNVFVLCQVTFMIAGLTAIAIV